MRRSASRPARCSPPSSTRVGRWRGEDGGAAEPDVQVELWARRPRCSEPGRWPRGLRHQRCRSGPTHRRRRAPCASRSASASGSSTTQPTRRGAKGGVGTCGTGDRRARRLVRSPRLPRRWAEVAYSGRRMWAPRSRASRRAPCRDDVVDGDADVHREDELIVGPGPGRVGRGQVAEIALSWSGMPPKYTPCSLVDELAGHVVGARTCCIRASKAVLPPGRVVVEARPRQRPPSLSMPGVDVGLGIDHDRDRCDHHVGGPHGVGRRGARDEVQRREARRHVGDEALRGLLEEVVTAHLGQRWAAPQPAP